MLSVFPASRACKESTDRRETPDLMDWKEQRCGFKKQHLYWQKRTTGSLLVAFSETLCSYYSREIPEGTVNPDGLETTAHWGHRWISGIRGTKPDRMSLNCVGKICNTCVNVHVVTQGERGPPGNNGDKGERGDDVSNKKKHENRCNALRSSSDFYHFDNIFILSVCVCVCFRVQVEKTGGAAK